MNENLICVLINSYNDYYFENVKQLFAANAKTYAGIKKDSLITIMLEILTSESIKQNLTRDQFSKLSINLFKDELKKDKWILDYINNLLSFIREEKGKSFISGRALKYKEYMLSDYNNLKKNWKNILSENDESQTLDSLIKYLKFTLAIYCQITTGDEENNAVADMKFDFNEGDVSHLASQFFIQRKVEEGVNDEKPAKKGVKVNIPGAIKKAAEDKIVEMRINLDQNDEKNHFYVFVTWLLFYRIAQEDGFSKGGCNNEC